MYKKVRIVNSIPGTDRQPRGIYFKYWKDLKKTPKGKFLEITAKPKEQRLISHHLYYRARKTHLKVSVTFQPKAMYAFWK